MAYRLSFFSYGRTSNRAVLYRSRTPADGSRYLLPYGNQSITRFLFPGVIISYFILHIRPPNRGLAATVEHASSRLPASCIKDVRFCHFATLQRLPQTFATAVSMTQTATYACYRFPFLKL